MRTINKRLDVLVETNVDLLEQAAALVLGIGDDAFLTTPPTMAPHKVSSHLRHILEFYDCFITGLHTGLVDYDARKREVTLEKSRSAVSSRILLLIQGLRTIATGSDFPIQVKMEDAPEFLGDACASTSSVERELQVLGSHTVHHFALIALTLRAHGIAAGPDFGMARSTLRHLARMEALANAGALAEAG